VDYPKIGDGFVNDYGDLMTKARVVVMVRDRLSGELRFYEPGASFERLRGVWHDSLEVLGEVAMPAPILARLRRHRADRGDYEGLIVWNTFKDERLGE
jgi:hypothetical protein